MTKKLKHDSLLPKNEQSELVQTLATHLSPQDKDNIMKTVAETYIEKGEHNKAIIIAKKNVLSRIQNSYDR